MIAPKDESSDLVMQWIQSEGLGDYATISPRLDAVIVEASISQIEKLLNAEYTPFGGFSPSISTVDI
jgi:tripeptidyl-peptidase I